jgi:hypothetical protein
MNASPNDSDTPYDRLRAAIDEWLDAFHSESTDQVRAELAQIAPTDTTDAILRRLDAALEILEGDATRLHDRGDEEQRKARALEEQAMDSIRAGDDRAAQDALDRQNEHVTRATRHFDDALQLRWMLNQYRTAAAAIRNRIAGER